MLEKAGVTVGVYPGRGLHGEVVRELGARITSGKYEPGSLIDPEQLEAELGVSKTVVREALRVLAAKGLVDSRPKRGTFVRARTAWSLLDIDVMQWRGMLEATDSAFLADLAEVRSIVEPAGVRLAAERRTDSDIAELEAALAAMAEAGSDGELVVAADLRFHLGLLRASHNELLVRMDVVIIHALGARDRLIHNSGDGWRDSIPSHRVVLSAVRAGKPAAAATAMSRLLKDAERDVQERLSLNNA
jgi:GntR family galactonate operon transcriptional repressor